MLRSSCDQFGTISGLRLGRLDTEAVPWEEINAAWGQSVLLLSVLMKRISFTSAKYILYPCGSFSSIAEIHDTSVKYELYGSETNFAKLSTRFNKAQELFLDCVHEFSLFVQSHSSMQLALPYKIANGKIADISVKFDLNAKEHWTRALRYMLQTLKTLLYWCIRER